MTIYLFTDIENSTAILTRFGDQGAHALARQDILISDCIRDFGGEVLYHFGDSVQAAFEIGQPLHCAIEIQNRLDRLDWGAMGEIRARVALGVGQVEPGKDQLSGPLAQQLNQMIDLGWGGQILLMPGVLEGQLLPTEAQVRDLGYWASGDKPDGLRVLSLSHPSQRLHSFPHLRAQSNDPQHVPEEKLPFIGRSEEINAITKLLDSQNCQILSILGAGGTGKSRLAGHVAALNAEKFRDGVYWVSLSAIKLPELLIPTIAQALGVNFFSHDDPKNQLQSFLRGKQLLLVLDNFEHIMEGAQVLSSVLASALKVKALITSRERLNLYREYNYFIEGLPYPDGEHCDQIEFSPAGSLFMQIARQVAPGFELAAEDRSQLQQICQTLQGLPLGLELAASWVRTLSIGEIALEIRRNLDFLVTSSPEIPTRHQSLSAVFEYSWNLLSEEERRALRKLAVFQGGFYHQAAEKIASAYTLTLTNLVDKSMLRIDEKQRYSLPETLRQFVERKQDAFPTEKERIQRLHADYFSAFLHERTDIVRQSGQQRALAEIRTELDNIRTAWDWAIQHRSPKVLAQGQETLFFFFETQGRFQEGYEKFSRAIACLQSPEYPEPDLLLAARLEANQGWFAFRLGRLAQGQQHLEHSLQIAQTLHSEKDAAFILYYLSQAYYLVGNRHTAEASARQSLDLYQRIEDPLGTAYARLAIISATYRHADYQPTRHMLMEALAIFEQHGNRHGISRVFSILGTLESLYKHHEEARQLYRKSIEICRELNDIRGMALSMNNLSSIEGELGDVQEMMRLQKEASLVSRSVGNHQLTAISMFNLADTYYRELQQYTEASKVYHELIEICTLNEDQRGLGYAHRDLGMMLIKMGQTAAAQNHFKIAIELATKMQDRNLAVNLMLSLSELLAAQERYPAAYRLLSLALRQPEYQEVNLREEYIALHAEMASRLAPAQKDELLAEGQDIFASLNEFRSG